MLTQKNGTFALKLCSIGKRAALFQVVVVESQSEIPTLWLLLCVACTIYSALQLAVQQYTSTLWAKMVGKTLEASDSLNHLFVPRQQHSLSE